MTASSIRARSTVEVELVRRHLRTLQHADISLRLAAHLAGISEYTVADINASHRPRHGVRASTAEKILAIDPADHPVVDAVGMRRRLMALGRDGYDTAHIASELGFDHATVHRWLRHRRIYIRYAEAVANLYQRWAGVPAEDNGVDPDRAARARAVAKRRKWASASRWDGESIDDPQAAAATWHDGHRRAEDLFEDSEELLAQRIPLDVVAERLGVKVATLQRARERTRSRARAAAALADPNGTP